MGVGPDHQRDRNDHGLAPKKALDPTDAFWIEVALGFGGRSPEEWQEVITPEWRDKLVQYREQYGPFHLGLRNERALARMTALHFKGLDPNKLLEWPKEPEEEATLEGVFGMFKSMGKKET